MGEATSYTGHVLKGSKMITAGWCNLHKEDSEDINLMTGPGCFGSWKKYFGMKVDIEQKKAGRKSKYLSGSIPKSYKLPRDPVLRKKIDNEISELLKKYEGQ